jgi:prepilin-type N-terminal cleavage/methylation domain-containing protein
MFSFNTLKMYRVINREVRNHTPKSAFTLVELLVVIAIIAMLAGIITPTVNFAREAARRNTCINNQRQIGLAIGTYANTNKGLPGALEQTAATTNFNPPPKLAYPSRSWVVTLLAQLGEPKRWEFLSRPANPISGVTEELLTAGEVNQAVQTLPVVLCPTIGTLRKDQLFPNQPVTDYVVNCGPAEATGITGPIAANFTLFKDRRKTKNNTDDPPTLVTPPSKVDPDKIADGVSNTVFLSENVQAGSWYPRTAATDTLPDWSAADELNDTRSVAVTAYIGFIWSPTALSGAVSKPVYSSEVAAPAQNLSRPSSMHPGTVVMLYADGAVKPMDDDVEPKIYLSAVCPDDKKAKLATSANGLGYHDTDFP